MAGAATAPRRRLPRAVGSTLFGARGASWRLRAGAGGGGGAAREEALAARGVTQLEAMERLVTTNDPWCCVGSKAALRGRGSRARPISLPVTARLSRYGIA